MPNGSITLGCCLLRSWIGFTSTASDFVKGYPHINSGGPGVEQDEGRGQASVSRRAAPMEEMCCDCLQATSINCAFRESGAPRTAAECPSGWQVVSFQRTW